jgi:mannose/cellobiose epimerase-like protein (N-acyl-D-glucosamine 2-epimerase family)
MPTQSEAAAIDLGWFRHHLLEEILPRWLPSITPEGLFLSHFDAQWRPLNKGYGTLVSQSRLLYNFSKGYQLTGDPRLRAAVEVGAAFLIDKFWDCQYGGWVWSCTTDGKVLDTRKDSYGHAFVIFGLAHACQCTGNQAFRQAALDTWQVLVDHFRDQDGGFRIKLSQDFQETDGLKSQNPIMHLFEALLALNDVPQSENIRLEAQQVGDFVLNRLVRSTDKMLPEVYRMDWRELPAEETGRIDIGHAFEWAFLLSSAVERGLPNHYLQQASYFVDYPAADQTWPGSDSHLGLPGHLE